MNERVVVVAVAAALGDPVVVRVVLVGLHHPVAVVVEAVAGLRGRRVDRRVAVVAVVAGQGAVAVAVQQLARQEAVDAVVVQAVADLDRPGVDRRLVVVAVAVLDREAVAVVVRGAEDAVAVEVDDAGVGLAGAREGAGVVVVAVALADPPAVGVPVLLVDRGQGVAVVVQAVAELHREAVPGQERVVVAVPVALGLAVAVVVDLQRHVAVAVVVHAVAGLRGARVRERIGVVAVPVAGHDPVQVHVLLVGVQGPGAGVVQSVALLRRARVPRRVQRSAVRRVGVAVAVVVDVSVVAVPVPVGVQGAARVQVHGVVVAAPAAVDPAQVALRRRLGGPQDQPHPPVVGLPVHQRVGQEHRGLAVDVRVDPGAALGQAEPVEGHAGLLDLQLELHVAPTEGGVGVQLGPEGGGGGAAASVDLAQGDGLQGAGGPGEGRLGLRVRGVAEEQGRHALVVRTVVRAAVVPQGRAHHHVGAAVAVDVARPGHRPAEPAGRLVRPGVPVGAGVVGAAEPDEGLPAVRVAPVGAGGAHDQVGPAVAVHVAGAVHRGAELVARGHAGQGDDRGAGHARGRPGVDQRLAGVGARAGVVPAAHDDVGVGVGGEVAEPRHVVAVLAAGAAAGRRPEGRGLEAAGGAEVDLGQTGAVEAVVPARGAHDQVVEQVAVHVAGSVQRVAQLVAVERAEQVPAGRRRQPRGGAVEDPRGTHVGPGRVPHRRADAHVRVAVQVHVAHAGHREADAVARLGALEGPHRPRGRRAAAGQEHRRAHPARSEGAVVHARRADQDVLVAVAVHVSDDRDGLAEAGVGLAARHPEPG